MRVQFEATEGYGAVKVVTGVATANNVELIQMLFDGFLDTLSLARGHIQHNAIEEKSRALSKAGRIVVGLQSALDFEKGGELAKNLNDLYAYVLRRLFLVNARNDLEILAEVHGLMREVAQAWQALPSLIKVKGASAYSVN